MKNFLLTFLLLFFLLSCTQDYDFTDQYPDNSFLEINFCEYEKNYSVTDLTESITNINKLKTKKFNSNDISSYYLDPRFETEDYDFIWLNIFSSKKKYAEFNFLKNNNKKYKEWDEDFRAISNCTSQENQKFHNLYQNNLNLFNDGKILKKYSFCNFLPTSNSKKLINFFDENITDVDLNIGVLIPEIINEYFDFILEESTIEKEDQISLTSQISFIADCNSELLDEDNDGLFFDSYSLKNTD